MQMTEKRKMGRIKLVLNTIKKYPDSSKSEIKKLSGLSMEVVLNYIEYLTGEGYIYKSKERGTGVGRKAECYRINSNGAYFIGIKFIARKFQAVLMDLEENVLKTYEKRYARKMLTEEELFDGIDDCIKNLTEEFPLKKITAIGISAPGLVNFKDGVLEKYSGMAVAKAIPVKAILEEKYGVKSYVCGTTKTKAISYQLTKAEGDGNYVYVFVGDGCSMAIMYNDKLYSGSENFDGELGFIRMSAEHGSESLTEIIGNGSIVEALQKAGKAQAADISDFIALVKERDETAWDILERVSGAMAYALSMLVAIYAPEQIIVCGDYTTLEEYKKGVLRNLKEYCIPEILEKIEVKFIKNEKSDNACDAARLCFYKKFYNVQLT